MTVAAEIPLIDDHCHGLLAADLSADEFRSLATESDWLSPPPAETLDSPFGLGIRSVCAPLLDLPKHAPIDRYIERRQELGALEVNRRLMGSTGSGHLIIDTGFTQSDVISPKAMTELLGTPTSEIVRLEAVAESLAATTTAAGFVRDFADALALASAHAVGFKSVAAYRFGLNLPEVPPDERTVQEAAGRWLSTVGTSGDHRIVDPVLLSHLVWAAVAHRKPIQFHVGFGDSDLVLHRSDPSHLTPFLRATRESGATFVLLHCYPFIRESGSLAHIFPHVYFDVGEVTHYLGPSARVAIRQSMEIAPFHKLLYSSDAYGLSEHYAVSAYSWRRETGRVLDEWLADDWIDTAGAEHIVASIAGDNARRVYGVDVI